LRRIAEGAVEEVPVPPQMPSKPSADDDDEDDEDDDEFLERYRRERLSELQVNSIISSHSVRLGAMGVFVMVVT